MSEVTASEGVLNTFCDDHEIVQVDRREHEHLGGATLLFKCRTNGCAYFRAEWEADRQTGLADFA